MPVFREYQKTISINESRVDRPLPTGSNRQSHDTSAKQGRITRPVKPARTEATNLDSKSGSWEDAIETIDACEKVGKMILVYVTWKAGHKTKQTAEQIYKRCPQKVRNRSALFVLLGTN